MRDLVTTKLYVPRIDRELVDRPRLIACLEAGSTGKLTLVSAPVGYGKTTLVSDWLTRSHIPAAWLSLESSDNQISRFFSYLISALQQIDPAIGTEIQPLLETGTDPSIEDILATLVNDIAASSAKFTLVLDDYHVISAMQIHQALEFLFEHMPPGMNVILISRADPPMPLARLRVQRQLTELREADLRFTADELSEFFNDLMGCDLSSEEITNLEIRTEGWIAGLQLVALALQRCQDPHGQIVAITGSHRHLIDYLVDEVMSQQSEEVRSFLLCTSILERFNASLCCALLQKPNGREMLRALEKARLFLVPLDDECKWYRYHRLFADFLHQRLVETRPEIVSELYQRAGDWYEAQGMIEEAIEYALTGNDATRAALILDEHIEFYIYNGEVMKVLQWTDRLPVEVRRRFPRLCIYQAWALQFEHRLDAVERPLELAEDHLISPNGSSESFPASQIIGHATAIRAYTALKRGEYNRAVELLLAAREALPAERTHAERSLQGIIVLGLGLAYVELGQTAAACQALQSAFQLNRQSGDQYAASSCTQYLMEVGIICGDLGQALANGERGLLWIEECSSGRGQEKQLGRMLASVQLQMGRVQYERNDLSRAARNLQQGCEFYEGVQSWDRGECYLFLVDLNQALGDGGAALMYWGKLKTFSRISEISLPHNPLAAQTVRRNLLLHRARPTSNELYIEAVDWASTSGLSPEDEFNYEQESDYLALAEVLIAQDRVKEAVPLLDRLISSAEKAGRKGLLIAYLSLQAVAYHSMDMSDTALTYLLRALALGEPEGYVRTFVDLGSPMRELLHLAAERDTSDEYVARLLDAFRSFESCTEVNPAEQPIPQMGDVLVEALSEREIQVLRLLADRLTYKEIAYDLCLSINTIKWYAKNVYGKLGVDRKDKAAARARELSIL